MRFWRIYQPNKTAPLSGRGAEIYGGRWNPKGLPTVYGASSQSLAMLEVLAHMEVAQRSRNFAVVEFEIDARTLPVFKTSELPEGWNNEPAGPPSQEFGRRQYEVHGLVGFRVPSVVVPQENDVVLFPQHQGFNAIEIVRQGESFTFDPRLFK